jgi:hypothetical protein
MAASTIAARRPRRPIGVEHLRRLPAQPRAGHHDHRQQRGDGAVDADER